MQAVLLAAGKSSRFWPLNLKHKSLYKICGKSLAEWTIQGLKNSGIDDIIIVQGPKRDLEKDLKSKYPEIRFVVQNKPNGMGNAVMQVENYIEEDFIVLNPHYPDVEYYINLSQKKRGKGSMVLIGKKTKKPELYGIFEFEGDKAKRIVEKPKREESPSNVKVLGIYFLPKDFFYYYRKVSEHQYSFEDALSLFMKENDVPIIISERNSPSFKYSWNLLMFNKKLLEAKENYVDESATIKENTVIKNCFVGKNVKILENSVLKNSYIGDNTVVGNHVLIRDSSIGNDCLIGAKCEIAKSLLDENVHTHSGFIGDSVIGKGCRIGAGVTTANVRLDRTEIKAKVNNKTVATGLKSLGCIIGENIRLGIKAYSMPGTLIGNNCIIGPNTFVKGNVKDNTLYYKSK